MMLMSIPAVNLVIFRRALSWPGVALAVAFVMLWMVEETLRWDDGRQSQVHQYSLDLAASDFVKSILSLLVWFVCWQLGWLQGTQSSLSAVMVGPSCDSSQPHLPTCNVPFHELDSEDPTTSRCFCREPHPRSSAVTSTLGIARLILPPLVVALVYVLRAYIALRARETVDSITLCLAFPMTVLVILLISRIDSWRNIPSPFWHATVLQFAGFFIARDALIGSMSPPYSLLIAYAFCDSIWISLIDVIYGSHLSSSVHLTNTMIFVQACLIHFLIFLLYPSHGTSHSYIDGFTVALQPSLLVEASKDIAAMFIIQQHGAISQGILISLASTLLITVAAWKSTEAPYSAFLGCLIAILGLGIFLLSGQHTDEQLNNLFLPTEARRYFATAMASLVALGYVLVVVSQSPGTHSSDLSSSQGKEKLSDLSKNRSDCRVPGSSAASSGQRFTDYTHFDNILLIVFFSHARYNTNLDFHREVYADYFPNIAYIGPATREDKGFSHSYDVLVDSFQSEEDLSDPLFYRMAGRMAHHMLYTALREYGCYDGYLWVPFDTLINVPRLQKFDQNLFWYHSPWGQPVPNPALEFGLDPSRHAPPAMISPDPSINLTESWRGWGPDWWWGDPHVGVSVCMDAFNKVPEEMRAHLAELNNGQTRLIGGSADTLYIPGRHRQALMDVLALFLETNCFLEIALPTTVHLVVPPGEPIQFVDHWWIYQPPFNASFVRQKWAEGYEVDTFHTFHWGERGEDGVWRGDHRHVADVRHLLWESAYRQGLNDTFPVKLEGEAGEGQ